MNIREIAKRAKVSTATVSRTINHHPSVQPQLAKRVLKVVEEMGYFPNTQARALVSGRSRIFGLIVSEITNPFFPEIIHVFDETAVQHNYEILVTSTVHDPERMKTSVRRMLEHRVEGVRADVEQRPPLPVAEPARDVHQAVEPAKTRRAVAHRAFDGVTAMLVKSILPPGEKRAGGWCVGNAEKAAIVGAGK